MRQLSEEFAIFAAYYKSHIQDGKLPSLATFDMLDIPKLIPFITIYDVGF